MSDRPRPRTQAEVASEAAQDAFQRGQALLAAGDPAGARRWLERARRFATDDDTVALALALALTALADPAAEPVLAGLAARHDVQEVWLALCAARLRGKDAPGGAAALGSALAGHRLANEAAVASLANCVVALTGAAGWCGLRPDGSVAARAAGGVRVRHVAGGRIAVTAHGRPLLGSPLDALRINRVEGAVWARDGGVEGWAWHPGDAARVPELRIDRRRVRAEATNAAAAALTRPRHFFVPAEHVPDGPVRVRGSDGRDLAGSPLDPRAALRAAIAAAAAIARALPLDHERRAAVPWLPTPAALAGPPARAPRRPRRPVAVVVPAYRGARMTLDCLAALFATVPPRTEIVVVDDASPEATLTAALRRLAAEGRIRLLRHQRNRGFVLAANAGLRVAARLPGGRDLVLLNSDTLPAPGWLARLRHVVHAAPDIGTATPLSNDATILTFPDALAPGPPPAAPEALAALAADVHPDTAVTIPTAVGFCMYIRRECLEATGLLRPDAFAQGYGEENDFSIRARHLGWRHVAVPGAFVAHHGGQSFGAGRAALLARNLDVLERLHPGYRALIAGWQAEDPLAPARRALDAARFAARPRNGGAVLVVTHDSRGGVERAVRERIAARAAEGVRTIVLRPVIDRSETEAATMRRYRPGLCRVGEGTEDAFPNLRFRLPDELDALAALLRGAAPTMVEVHHLLGHDHAVLQLADRLGIPTEFFVHDYAAFCPRINLIGTARRYCGEPAQVADCEACVSDAGSLLEEPILPGALRARSADDFAKARRVVVPSPDAAARLARHFPQVRPIVAPHESDADLPPLLPIPPPPRVVGVVGAIGVAKGFEVLLACARDAAARDLPLRFTVIGHTEDDARLIETGRVFVTGPFEEADGVALIRASGVHLGLLPSLWPETWCYALGTALRTGLAVAAFDIGAPAARIRATGRGWVLPLGLPAAALNNALLASHLVAGDECARPAPPRPLMTARA